MPFLQIIGDGRGDLCEDDFDGDMIKDYLDDCPANRNVTVLDFRSLILIPLDPIGSSQKDPKWTIRNKVCFIIYVINMLILFVNLVFKVCILAES